jgi:hypothetical protein
MERSPASPLPTLGYRSAGQKARCECCNSIQCIARHVKWRWRRYHWNLSRRSDGFPDANAPISVTGWARGMRAAQTRPSLCGQVETAAARAFVWIDCFGRKLSATASVRATATVALLPFESPRRTARPHGAQFCSVPSRRTNSPICQDRVPREFRSNLGLGTSAPLVDVGPPLFRTLVVVPMMRCENTAPKQPWPGNPNDCRYGLRQPFLVAAPVSVRAVTGLRSGGPCSASGSGSGTGVLAQFTHEFPSRCGLSPGYRQQTGARPVVSDDVLSTVDGTGGQWV